MALLTLALASDTVALFLEQLHELFRIHKTNEETIRHA